MRRMAAGCSTSSLAARRRKEARRLFQALTDAHFGVVHSFQVYCGIHEIETGNEEGRVVLSLSGWLGWKEESEGNDSWLCRPGAICSLDLLNDVGTYTFYWTYIVYGPLIPSGAITRYKLQVAKAAP